MDRGSADTGSDRQGAALVGREREFAALTAFLDDVARGNTRAGTFEGEAGIGKTCLLDEALEQTRARGFTVHRGAAGELARELPFAPLAEALDISAEAADPRRAELGLLLLGRDASTLQQADSPALRYRLIEGIVALVESLATTGPVVLAIEDVHWADASTLLALSRVAERVAALPLALLVTARPAPRSPELDALLAGLPTGSLRLTLAPLAPGTVASLVTDLAGAEPAPSLIDQLAGAAGNPLYVRELVGALQDEDLIYLDNGQAQVRPSSLPPSLRLTILRRLSFLSEDSLDVLRVASVLGSQFSFTDLATVLGRPAADLLRPLAEPLRAGVIEEAGDGLTFRHELVRAAIYDDLARSARLALHVQAGHALAGAGAPAAQVATHFARGATTHDPEAAKWLVRAARDTAPRAPSVAVDFLERSLELVGDDDPERSAMRAELARSLMWAGRLGEAEALSRELLADGAEPAPATEIRYALGRSLAYQGRLEESIAVMEDALSDEDLTPVARARLQAELSHRELLSGAIERAAATAGAARAAGDRHGDDLAAWTALCALSWTELARGRVAGAVALAREAVERARRSAIQPVQTIQPRLYLAFALMAADDLEDGRAQLAEALRAAEDLGAAWALPLLHTGLAVCDWHAGAWGDAAAGAETALRLADETGTRVWRASALGVLAAVAYHRDDFDAATRAADAAKTALAEGSARLGEARLLTVRALLAEARGDAVTAATDLGTHWDAGRSAGAVGDWREMAPDLVRLTLAVGDTGRAREVTATVEGLAAEAGVPAPRAVALRCRGLVEGDAGMLEDAAGALHDSPRRLERAAAGADAGIALLERDRRKDGARHLDNALGLYEEIGAVRDAARAEATMRSLGVRRGRRGARRRPDTGWESLTDSERRVALLVAQGLTNPQVADRLFVSRRTVETHVSHALAKLDVTSRVQLATEAARATGTVAGPEAPTAP